MTVKDIFNFLNNLYPCNTACDFDNVGLLVGDSKTTVSKVLISLDCTVQAVEKAKETGCQLIVTHHPVIFSPLKSVTAGSIQYELIKNGISVISMHTNLDIAENGVSDCLCKILDLKEIKPYTACDGFTLRIGKTSPLSADNFADKIKAKLGGVVKYVDSGKPIQNVLVCSGSGGEFIEETALANADALVTAEVKHHQFLRADELGVSVFDAGHFCSEDVIVEPLKEVLQNNFPNIVFFTDHSSKIKYK